MYSTLNMMTHMKLDWWRTPMTCDSGKKLSSTDSKYMGARGKLNWMIYFLFRKNLRFLFPKTGENFSMNYWKEAKSWMFSNFTYLTYWCLRCIQVEEVNCPVSIPFITKKFTAFSRSVCSNVFHVLEVQTEVSQQSLTYRRTLVLNNLLKTMMLPRIYESIVEYETKKWSWKVKTE